MAATSDEIRAIRNSVAVPPIYLPSTGRKHGSRNNLYDEHGYREDGAKRITGVKPRPPMSNLDAHYARQKGAPSSRDPRFAGVSDEDVARDMYSRGERTGFGGKGIVPDNPFAKPMPTATDDKDEFGLPYGPDNPKPGAPAITDSAAMGKNMIAGAAGPGGTAGNMAASALRQSIAGNTGVSGPAAPPVDPSTVRQPFVGKLDENSDTPAKFRQMVSDAAMGRTTNTSGRTGLNVYPTSDPSTQTQQAQDFRRSIVSKYGTGTNETRQPGQGPATIQDLMGRTVPMQQWLGDQKAVQASKDRNGWVTAKSPKVKQEEEDIDEAEAKGEGDPDQRKV